MDWAIVLTGLGIVISVVGCNLALFSWLRTDIKDLKQEISADRRDILMIIREMKDEMKDFQARMERQDAEFKAHMNYYHKKD